MSSPADPLGVPCPRCSAGRNEPCVVDATGRTLPRAHRDRARRAIAEAEAARKRADGDAAHRIATPRFRRLYAAARLELEGRAAWTPLAAEQLETIALNMEAAEAARAKARDKPLVEGSMGQDVANPAVAIALRYDAQALATARALKLTPDTRGAAAPAVGDDAPDDADRTDDQPKDELADLDELATRRKKGARRRRPAG